MEHLHVNRSSGDLRSNSPATNPAEIAQINSANRLDPSCSSPTSELPSQDQFQFVTNTTSASPHNHDQDLSQPQSHHQFSVLEQGNGSTRYMHLGTQPDIAFAEHHPNALENISAPPSSISSSQNPFEFPSDGTDRAPVGANVSENVRDQENSGMTNNNLSTNPAGSNDMLGLQSSLSFSANESSHADPSQVMPSSNAQTHPANDTHDETHLSSSTEHLGPSSLLSSSALESSQNQGSLEIGSHNNTIPFMEQEYESTTNSNMITDPIAVLGEAGVSENAASNPHTDTNGALNVEMDLRQAAESSDDDIPISSMPKNEKTIDVDGSNSTSVGAYQNLELDSKNLSEVQNRPLQVMESPRDSNHSSEYRIPSHVFARNKSTTAEWSTASNESLFSIQMGNMSFSKDFYWGKSGELYSPQAINMSSPLIPPSTPTNQHPVQQQQQQGKSGELYSPHALNISSPLIPPSIPTTQPPVQQQQQRRKSDELYSRHAMNISSPLIPSSIPTNQPPVLQQQQQQHHATQPPPPSPLVNKLNDNSQPDDLNDGSRLLEAKAADTMREVMREKTENIGKGDLSFADGTRGIIQPRISHYSHQSDGSTKSFVFPILTDVKSASSKRGDNKASQQNSEVQDPKETPNNAAASSKSSPKASKWLPSCISCCWLPAKS